MLEPDTISLCSLFAMPMLFALHLVQPVNPKSEVKVVERTRGNTGIPKRMVRSAANEIGRSMWPEEHTLAIWQIRNHLSWGLQRDRSIRVDGLRKCSTMGSQRAGDRRKFLDPFRSELCDYLLQADKKLIALVSLVEVASRAHLYKDLVICGRGD
jgi:hypothetical protein